MERKPLSHKIAYIGASILSLDSIISPILTGQTIHEHCGIPPASDYNILGDMTALTIERILWGVGAAYIVYKDLFCKK